MGNQDQSRSGLQGVTTKNVASPWASGHATVMIFFAQLVRATVTGEMPKIAAYLRSHDAGPVEVFGDDQRRALSDRPDLREEARRRTFPVAFDPNNSVSVGVFGFYLGDPETVFVNAQGVVKEVTSARFRRRELVAASRCLRAASRSETSAPRAAARRPPRARGRSSQLSVGASPRPRTRWRPSAMAPDGSAMTTAWRTTDGSDVSGITMPESSSSTR